MLVWTLWTVELVNSDRIMQVVGFKRAQLGVKWPGVQSSGSHAPEQSGHSRSRRTHTGGKQRDIGRHFERSPRPRCIQGGPKKTRLFSDLITLWRLVLERRAVCQNFRNFIEKKRYKTRISVSLNILCQICSNHHNSWNYAIYDQNTWILLNLH